MVCNRARPGDWRMGELMDRDLTLEAILNSFASAVALKLQSQIVSTHSHVPQRLLSVEQAATYIGRTKTAVQHMVSAKKLPVVRDGNRVFLDIRELDRWIERNTEPAEV